MSRITGGPAATIEREPQFPRVNGAPAAVVPSARLPLPSRQRKPGYVALAVLLIVGLGVAGGFAYDSAGAKTPVVVVVRQVPKGHVVTRADLSTTGVSGGVVAIAGANLDSVLGETATVDLLPNTLLQRSMVTDGPLLPAGQAQVGVQVTGGQIPADGLQPGDTVEVLQLPAKGVATTPGAPAASVLVAAATVFSTRPDPSQASGTLVTLVVPAAAAPGIAAASSGGAVALVRVAP